MLDGDRFSALLQSPQVALVGADLDGTITTWSCGATELYGWAAQDIVGRPITVLAPDDLLNELTSIREAVAHGRDCAPVETVRLTVDGTRVPVEMHALTVRDAGGAPVGTVALYRDLQPVHRAQTALTASVEELRAHFADSPVPQSRVDMRGHVLAVNAAMEELLGEPAADLLGRGALGMYPETDRSGLEAALTSLASGAESYVQQERTLVRADGRQVPIVMTVTVIRDVDGNMVLAGSVQDVSALKVAQARVQAEVERFEALLTSVPVTVFTYDVDGRCTSARGQGLKLLGATEDQHVGVDLLRAYADYPVIRDALLASLAGQGAQAVVDLADHVWQCHYQPLRDGKERIHGGIGIALDVTDRVRAERVVQANEARMRALLREADDVVLVLDQQGRFMYVSPAVTRVLGLEERALFWQPASEFNHPDDRASVARAWRTALERHGATATVLCRVRHGDGSWRWCEHVLTNLMADPDVGGMVVNLRDVTERRRTANELQRAALHDPLTGLANRFLLLDRVGQAMTWARHEDKQTGLILLGVLGMTAVNEALGHTGGDAALRAIGERLLEAVRDTDSLARVGGNHFALLIEDVASAEDLRARASALVQTAQGAFAFGGQQIDLRLHAGSAMTPAADAGALLSAAERALPAGPGAPRAVAVAAAAVEHDDRIVAAELRRAVDRGELRLHFQPVLSLRDGEVAGVEALVRWQHPERGLLMPSEFIPLAESSGVVEQLGEWVLREACARSAEWQAAGRTFGVGLNLSPRQMVGGRLVDLVRAILRDTGAHADRLVLEVTESSLMDDPYAAEVLRELRSLGVRLALDDFGTGYSSLTYLRRFPVDAIKIDRSFVSGLGRNADDEAIVAAVVSLGRAVGKILVAEGVETVRQLGALRALGVDQAQGYLWSPALPADELVNWIDGHRPAPLEPPEPQPVASPTTLSSAPTDGAEVRILALHGQGASLHTIAAALNAEGCRTAAGPRWTTSTVARVVAALARPI